MFFFFEDIYFFFCIKKSTQKLQIKIIFKIQFLLFLWYIPRFEPEQIEMKMSKEILKKILHSGKFFIITAIFFYLHLAQIFAQCLALVSHI